MSTTQVEERLDTATWSACCSKTDVGFIKYVTQVGVAVMLIIFSMIQISIEADNREIYFSMISGMVGLLFPHPQVKVKNVKADQIQ
jgi:hypothetical protein